MKQEQEIIGEACRIEHDEDTGKIFLVFEITNLKYKQEVINTWTNDIEYIILNKKLIKNV